jgi:hypothetical protein
MMCRMLQFVRDRSASGRGNQEDHCSQERTCYVLDRHGLSVGGIKDPILAKGFRKRQRNEPIRAKDFQHL